jgi:hypothetical protein
VDTGNETVWQQGEHRIPFAMVSDFKAAAERILKEHPAYVA